MKEYPLTELGYFTERECQKLKEILEGKTFMNLEIGWSNCAGNCTLILKTDYDETREEIVNFFFSYALCVLAERGI